jgi:hypothetical protein
VIGLYIAFVLPIILRIRQGDRFEAGAWSLGRHYKWISPIAVAWIGIVCVLFLLPVSPKGIPGAADFDWNVVNYAPLTVGGALLLFGGWYVLSARKWFTGPVREVSEEEPQEPTGARRGGRRSRPAADVAADVRAAADVPQGDQQGPQRPRERGPLVVVEAGEDAVLVRHVVGQGAVDERPARRGQRDEDAPARRPRGGARVTRPRASSRSRRWVIAPEVTMAERMSSVGDSGPVVAAQGGEHVERGGVEVVGGERGPQLRLDEPGRAREPADHPHRGHVEVGPLLRPLGQEVVHGVGGGHGTYLSGELN